MSDPLDEPMPPPAAPRPKRTRKFVLPDEVPDERTTSRIEAFIEGPPQLRERRPGPYIERERRPVELDTRQDWLTAYRYEAARHARYGRPVSVLLVELPRGLADDSYDRMAARFAEVIRSEARDPDRAVRFGRTRFQILLAETGSRAASAAAERLQRAFTPSLGPSAAFRPALIIEVASPHRNEFLEDAVAFAERRLKQ